MNKNFYCCALLLAACLLCVDGKAPQMYGYKRGKNFDKINWKNFMAKASRSTNEWIKMSTPYVLQNYPVSNVSETCTNSLVLYVDGIKNWKKWAIRMFDVTGKIPSSFKRGASIEFGSYDDCLRIEVPSSEASAPPSSAQFCMLHLHTSTPYLLEEVTPFAKYASVLVPSLESSKRTLHLHLGICTPPSCSEQDIYNIVTALIKFTNASVSNCETNEPKESSQPTQYALIALSCLLGLCLLGTRLDSYDQENTVDRSSNIFLESLRAFSIPTNSAKLFDKDRVGVEIRRISSVLLILCICAISCSTIVFPTPWKDMRYTTIRDISMAVWFADNFVVAMDAIFFVSGFLSVFILWRVVERSGGITGVFKELIKIYLRLSAVTVTVILLSFAFSLIYYGPLWTQTWNEQLVRCQTNGWLNLFVAQTQLPIDDTCWMHTWYPALAMQFFIATIPLIFILNRYPKIGFAIGLLLSAVFFTTDSTISLKTLDSLHYMELTRVMVPKFYSKPLLYFLPYLLGILAGRISIRFKDQQLSKILHVVGWSLSIVICWSVVNDRNFSKFNLDQSSLDLEKRSLYLCLALFWIMYASITDGFVGRMFSSAVIWPVARVGYCAYMIHALLIITREAALKERIYIGKLTLIIEATSHTAISIILGMLMHVMAELPIARLCELYIGHDEKEILNASAEFSDEKFETSGEQKDDKKDS